LQSIALISAVRLIVTKRMHRSLKKIQKLTIKDTSRQTLLEKTVQKK